MTQSLFRVDACFKPTRTTADTFIFDELTRCLLQVRVFSPPLTKSKLFVSTQIPYYHLESVNPMQYGPFVKACQDGNFRQRNNSAKVIMFIRSETKSGIL